MRYDDRAGARYDMRAGMEEQHRFDQRYRQQKSPTIFYVFAFTMIGGLFYSEMMAQTEETNKRQDVADSLSTQQDEKHDTRFQQLEKRLVDLINKNQLKEGKKRA